MFLQPLVEASSGRVEGAEALVRMKDKDGSIVGPAEFIDMASATGAVSILGEQVFAKVCEFIRDGGLEACGMKWVQRLNDIRENYGVPVSTVRLELTEQGALNSAGFKQVGLLKNMGFDLALDDYGTGFSNASRMKDIPFEEIKIDVSLVRGHFAHPDSYLPNLIQSMHRMGFKVVAEGVETKEMVDGLKRMGCDYFQGFYYSKPVSMQDFLKKYSLKEEKREVFTPSERAYEETERYGSVFAATLSDNSR